jgi:hypothetical protein
MECLAQAREAERLALDAEPNVKEAYLSIAKAWKQLAEEIARAIAERSDAGISR